MQKPTVTEGHPGYTYPVIPGPPCRYCNSTGWTPMHGMPRNTRNGARFFDHGCNECGRDPTKYIMAEIQRKLSSPNEARPIFMTKKTSAAEYLYMVAAKKSSKHCKGLIPWERVNPATRTGFKRLAKWVKSQGIELPPTETVCQ